VIETGADVPPHAAVAGPEPGGPLLNRWAVLVAAVVTLGLVAAVGFVVGADVKERHHVLGGWHTGRAHVGVEVVSIDYDGWVYGASGSVNAWIDRRGSWHDSGWPTCLRVPAGRGRPVGDVSVRFAAHEVTVGDRTWRPIVAIDCRGTAPRR
jgi:hypothetical protein